MAECRENYQKFHFWAHNYLLMWTNSTIQIDKHIVKKAAQKNDPIYKL